MRPEAAGITHEKKARSFLGLLLNVEDNAEGVKSAFLSPALGGLLLAMAGARTNTELERNSGDHYL